MKSIITMLPILLTFALAAQPLSDTGKWRPLVNQAGYNLGESKRFVCYGAADGTAFRIFKRSGE